MLSRRLHLGSCKDAVATSPVAVPDARRGGTASPSPTPTIAPARQTPATHGTCKTKSGQTCRRKYFDREAGTDSHCCISPADVPGMHGRVANASPFSTTTPTPAAGNNTCDAQAVSTPEAVTKAPFRRRHSLTIFFLHVLVGRSVVAGAGVGVVGAGKGDACAPAPVHAGTCRRTGCNSDCRAASRCTSTGTEHV